jgi:hypothetical protein
MMVVLRDLKLLAVLVEQCMQMDMVAIRVVVMVAAQVAAEVVDQMELYFVVTEVLTGQDGDMELIIPEVPVEVVTIQ